MPHLPLSKLQLKKDLCSFIDTMDANSFRVSSASSVQDTFREIRDNTFGVPGKTVAQTYYFRNSKL